MSASLPGKLLHDFDAMARRKGYSNRSLALADMIRDNLVEEDQDDGNKEMCLCT